MLERILVLASAAEILEVYGMEHIENKDGDPKVNAHFFTRMGNISFDHDVWMQYGDTKNLTRVYMLYDLVRTHHLIGMTQADIHALLGEPLSGVALASVERCEIVEDAESFLAGPSIFQIKYSSMHTVTAFRLLQFSDGHRYPRKMFTISKWFSENLSIA
jgi:hypothetical protein